MRIPQGLVIATLGAGMATGTLPAPEASAKATPKPLVYTEKYSEKLQFDAENVEWYAVPALKTKVLIRVPFDEATVGVIDGDTALEFDMGDFEWSDVLGSEDSNWQEGMTAARWTYREHDPDTGKALRPYLVVTASWKGGVLKLKVQGGIDPDEEGTILVDDYIGDEDVYDDEAFDAEIYFGEQDFYFDGSARGSSSLKTITRDEGDYDVAKVTLSGKAVLVGEEVDADAPTVLFNAPLDGDILADGWGGINADIDILDASHVASVSYSLDGGLPVDLAFSQVQEPDGSWSANVKFFLGVPDGTHTLEIIATDEFDNTAEGVDTSVDFDYTWDGFIV